MIYRLELLARAARRWVSRSEWAIRILGLPESEKTTTAPGLVMIQIDGLSHAEFRKALENGEMPFLGSLERREDYRLHHHYSGLPASTPAVQGELFYGVKGAVPAFSFLDRDAGRIVRMFDPAAASAVEERLTRAGEPLLEGGSAYCDIFAGGAAESHFCPASLGWGSLLRAANPFALALLFLANARSFLRMAGLIVVELFLALADCARGLTDGHDLWGEVKLVPTRAAICVLLRELITIGAEMDVARGLPIVHLNYLGYDEQAHRRGPSSKFAHWSLKGIDGCVARVWRAAKRSARREYDVWIYSDHGQEETRPYALVAGRSLEEAVAQAFDHTDGGGGGPAAARSRGEQSHRVRLLGGRRLQRLFPVYGGQDAETKGAAVATTSMGPVALVYAAQQLSDAERTRIARVLVDRAGIPMVLARSQAGGVRAWTGDGEFDPATQGDRLLGADHPFLREATADLGALCAHPDAGQLVLCGWRAGTAPLSFAVENGAHGGPGPAETGAFALLPRDTPLAARAQGYLRPADLRHAALHVLRRRERRTPRDTEGDGATRRSLRVMTYNVHRCLGMDGKLSPERIARVISLYDPDVVALQELDVGRARTGGVDQAHRIAQHLEMAFHFHPAIHVEEERYGDAILTHLPMRLVAAGQLPASPRWPRLEPRGALWVAVELGDTEIQVINTHLSLRPSERMAQAEALLGAGWLGRADCRPPIVLCGDFNALPSSPVCRKLRGRLRDAQAELDSHQPAKTFFGRYPTARIDHLFVDPDTSVMDVEVPSSELARVASDHLPLIVELEVPRPARARGRTMTARRRRRRFPEPVRHPSNLP